MVGANFGKFTTKTLKILAKLDLVANLNFYNYNVQSVLNGQRIYGHSPNPFMFTSSNSIYS